MKPKRLEKAILFNQKELANGDFTGEQLARIIQFWQEHHDLADDGWCGTYTQGSVDADIQKEWTVFIVNLGDESQFVDGKWLPWDGPEDSQPKSYSDAFNYLGHPETSPGSDKLNKTWYKQNIVELQGSSAIPGIPPKYYFKIHRKVLPYLREALRRAALSAPDYHITIAGGFVFRHIRNDPDRPLSMHALGCAIDFNWDDNYIKTFKRGKTPKAWSAEWLRYWPKGVPEAFVQALTSCGFASGMDWDEDGSTQDHTFIDPMHFEWLARDSNQFYV